MKLAPGPLARLGGRRLGVDCPAGLCNESRRVVVEHVLDIGGAQPCRLCGATERKQLLIEEERQPLALLCRHLPHVRIHTHVAIEARRNQIDVETALADAPHAHSQNWQVSTKNEALRTEHPQETLYHFSARGGAEVEHQLLTVAQHVERIAQIGQTVCSTDVRVDHPDVRVAPLDLQHLLQVDWIRKAPGTRDVEHHDPTMRIDDLKLVMRQEIEDRDVGDVDVRWREVQVGLQSQEAATNHLLLQLLR